MRQINRILKIEMLEFPNIYFISNSGEHKILNIKNLFKKLNIKKDDFGYELLINKELFNNVVLINNALAWEELVKKITLPSGRKIEAYFHLDPIVTIENSESNTSKNTISILGNRLKELRKSLKLSQEELGQRIGSNKQYISKLENNQTDPEFKTIRKIYEVGLNKKVIIVHYDNDEDPLNSITNSIFKHDFLAWGEKNKQNLELIEGVGEKVKCLFYDKNIKTTEDLSKIHLNDLINIIPNKSYRNLYHHPDSWITQAKCINSSDWLNAIKMQRILYTGTTKTVYSKIEDLAKKELKDDIFIVK